MSDIVWTGKPLVVSNSEIQTWKRCHRKWYLAYYREMGLKRAVGATGARELGTRIHVALESYYADGLNPIHTVDDLYKEDLSVMENNEAFTTEDINKLKKERDLAHAMLEGYLMWIAEEGVDEGLTLIAAETVLEVASGIKGVRLRGKLDQRVHRASDGSHLFLDHKTVGDLSTPQQVLPMDEQMKFYHLLEYLDSLEKTDKEQPVPTMGGLYNMLRKVKRTATAKPPFYGRLEVTHNKEELRTMWTRVHSVIAEIIVARKALKDGADHHHIAYPRPSRECTWDCDFFALCPMMDDGSRWEAMLDEYYVHVDPHERYLAEDSGKEVTK